MSECTRDEASPRTVVENAHSLEIEAWLTLREAYLADTFGEQPIQIQGTILAIDMGPATAWCQKTSHHEPVFMVHALDHPSAGIVWNYRDFEL